MKKNIGVNPGKVDWTGDNSGIFLRDKHNDHWSCFVSYFKVVYSPFGHGNAAFILTDPTGKNLDSPNICCTDNEDLAKYALDDFLINFDHFHNAKNLLGYPFEKASFSIDISSTIWTVKINSPKYNIILNWSDFMNPYYAEIRKAESLTKKHDMFSCFIPAKKAEVIVNNVKSKGEPIPMEMWGKKSKTAILALSETWTLKI